MSSLVEGIFCNLVKAFDCVNNDILLSKLKFCGISDMDFQLYQSYLGNGYCRTAIYNDSEKSNKVSNWAKVCETWSPTRFYFGTSTFSFIYK